MTDGEGDLGQAQAALTEVKGRWFPLTRAYISCWALDLGGGPGSCGPEDGSQNRCPGHPFVPSLYRPLCLEASIKSWGWDYVSAPHRQHSFRSFELEGLEF